jgi:hypothetical protein
MFMRIEAVPLFPVVDIGIPKLLQSFFMRLIASSADIGFFIFVILM